MINEETSQSFTVAVSFVYSPLVVRQHLRQASEAHNLSFQGVTFVFTTSLLVSMSIPQIIKRLITQINDVAQTLTAHAQWWYANRQKTGGLLMTLFTCIPNFFPLWSSWFRLTEVFRAVRNAFDDNFTDVRKLLSHSSSLFFTHHLSL